MNAVIRALGATAIGALGAASGYVIAGPDAAIPAGLVSFVVALSFRWTHPHRWRQLTADEQKARMLVKEYREAYPLLIGHWREKLLPTKQQPVGWISYYIAPVSERISYLRVAYDGEGFIYVPDEAQASVFATEADARAPTPVYDGSSNIGQRAGVRRVNRTPNVDHTVVCRTCREGGDCGAHLTFPEPPPTGTIVQSLFLGICPDEQTPTLISWDDHERGDTRHFKCKGCEGHWTVRVGNAKHMRDFGNFDLSKWLDDAPIKPEHYRKD